MIRSGSIGVCAGLAFSLFALGCGSSNSSGESSNLAPWDQARIGNTGTAWKMNLIKNKFFASVKLGYSDLADVQGRAQAVSVGKLVAEKMASTAALPRPEEVSGKWINDPDVTVTAQGQIVATDEKKITDDYIDGGAAPFYTSSYRAKTFVWANYLEDDASKDSPLKFELILWEMNSAAEAKTLFGDLLNNSLYSNVSWTTCVAKDANSLCP
jgi:hypothetical protein